MNFKLNDKYAPSLIVNTIKDFQKYIKTCNTFDGLGLLVYTILFNKAYFEEETYEYLIKKFNSPILDRLTQKIEDIHEVEVMKGKICNLRLQLLIDPDFINSAIFKNRITEIFSIVNFDNRLLPTWLDGSEKEVNFGFAHGLAGILNFYCILYEYNFHEKEQLRDNIEKLFSFIMIHTISQTEYNLFAWPTSILKEDYLNNNYSTYNRYPLSWCYGISGLTVSLYRAAKILELDDLGEGFINNILSSLEILTKKDIFLSSMFCHGIGGVVVCLRILYTLSSDIRLLEWINKILERFKHFYYDDQDVRERLINYDYDVERDCISESLSVDSLINGQISAILSLLNLISDCQYFEYLVCLK